MWGRLRLSEGHSAPFRCGPLNSKLASIKEPAEKTAAADFTAVFVQILSEM